MYTAGARCTLRGLGVHCCNSITKTFGVKKIINLYCYFVILDFFKLILYGRIIVYNIVPRVQVKRRPSAAGFLPAPTQMALCLRLAYIDF